MEANTLHEYKLYARDAAGNELDSVTINTSTMRTANQVKLLQKSNTESLEKSKDTLYFPMLNSNLNVVYNNERLMLSWNGIPSEDGIFEVYKNEEYLTTVNDNTFIDYDIREDEIYTYSIKGYKKIPDKVIAEKKDDIQKQLGKKLTPKEEDIVFNEPKIVSATIRISDEGVIKTQELKNQDISQNKINLPNGYGYLLRYTTFIPFEHVKNPWCNAICLYKFFGGDGENRGFDAWSSKFRTRLDTYVTWDYSGKPQGVTASPQTGITHGYDGNLNLIGSAKAPAIEDHKVWATEIGDGWIYHRGSVSSSIPLTAAPAIDAFHYSKVWENGRSEFYGVHDQAPSHEFYIIAYPGDFSLPIHQSNHLGFEYLLPVMPKKEWQNNIY